MARKSILGPVSGYASSWRFHRRDMPAGGACVTASVVTATNCRSPMETRPVSRPPPAVEVIDDKAVAAICHVRHSDLIAYLPRNCPARVISSASEAQASGPETAGSYSAVLLEVRAFLA